MFEQALKRLFLIMLPLIFLGAAFVLTSTHPTNLQQPHSKPLKQEEQNCNLLLGLSFFSNQKKTQSFSSGVSYLLTQDHLVKALEQTQSLSRRKIFFVLPLVLNKEEEWMISQKNFFILPTGERKQISHLNYSDIIKYQKSFQIYQTNNTPESYAPALTFKQTLSYLPENSSFLFYLLGSHRQKVIKNLDKALSEITGDIYISSLNDKLLNELQTSPFSSAFQILYSFKALIRMEMLSLFPYSSFKGDGVIAPASFSFTKLDRLTFFNKENKLLFLEKDPPYTNQDLKWIKKSQGLITSQIQPALNNLTNKKVCL